MGPYALQSAYQGKPVTNVHISMTFEHDGKTWELTADPELIEFTQDERYAEVNTDEFATAVKTYRSNAEASVKWRPGKDGYLFTVTEKKPPKKKRIYERYAEA